jgi:hypothetical protein
MPWLDLGPVSVGADYVKKEYALDDVGATGYKMIKALAWQTDQDTGRLSLQVMLRDLSGAVTTTIIDNIPSPLASGSADGVMPRETFATVEELVTKVAVLTGGLIPRGNVNYQSNEVTPEILTAYIQDACGRAPILGDGVKDAANVTWYFNGNDWIKWGNDSIGQATNDEPNVTGALGIVKGKNTNGYVFIENDGSMSVVGWDTLVAAVTALDEAKFDASLVVFTTVDPGVNNPTTTGRATFVYTN